MLHSYAFACPNYLKRVVDGVKLKQFSECHEPQPCRQQYRAFPGWLGAIREHKTTWWRSPSGTTEAQINTIHQYKM